MTVPAPSVVISQDLAFRLLDELRLAPYWMLRDQDDADGNPVLGDDFKPHKWPDDLRLEAADEIVATYRELLKVMQGQIGEDADVRS